ncbi:hypothetical protein F4824DRAFT_462811 [Ustulina deusta]|nr:hypothetical protein F4824DRAFT_462811 [Ustulina deusta]
MHHPEVATSQEPIREKVRQILGATPSGPALNIQLDRKRVVPLETGPSRVEKSFDMGAILQWQFDHHRGHVHSFQDTARYGPLQGREDCGARFVISLPVGQDLTLLCINPSCSSSLAEMMVLWSGRKQLRIS